MDLRERILEDLKESMKAKDERRTAALRMLKSQIRNVEIDKKTELDETQILEVVQKAVKQRKDSIEQYREGGRKDLVDQEEAELKILQAYLPEQLDEAAVRLIVQEAVKETGAQSAKDMGKVMGKVMPQVKGRADGRLVRQIVQTMLG